MSPSLDAAQYGFTHADEAPAFGDAFALIREEEGVTMIGPGKGWARITLGIESSLEAVGLTARVSTALAERGIGANIVAAFHHDHVFVSWERRDEALAALKALATP